MAFLQKKRLANTTFKEIVGFPIKSVIKESFKRNLRKYEFLKNPQLIVFRIKMWKIYIQAKESPPKNLEKNNIYKADNPLERT